MINKIEKVTAYKTNEYDVTEKKEKLVDNQRETVLEKYTNGTQPCLSSHYWSRPGHFNTWLHGKVVTLDDAEAFADRRAKSASNDAYYNGRRHAIRDIIRFFPQIMQEFKDLEITA